MTGVSRQLAILVGLSGTLSPPTHATDVAADFAHVTGAQYVYFRTSGRLPTGFREYVQGVGQGLLMANDTQLAERLAAINNPNALSLEGVDGLFCALVGSPDLVSPSEYVPLILGGEAGESGALADLDDAGATMSLLMRYWNSIIADFERESIHLPYIVEPGVDGILGRAWAGAFLQGTRLAPYGWEELWNSETEGQLLSIPLVAGEMDPAWPPGLPAGFKAP